MAVASLWPFTIPDQTLAAPSSPTKKKKNVLLIVSDDLKASALGCYGNPVCKTPSIDDLAARGMLFERAYCQGTWCAPSRQSFMFSQYQKGEKGGNINLAEHFKNHGWYSARVGKIYHMRVPGDIIDGTDGADIPSSWTEKFNSSGREAHTPGDYACLNLNIFTDKLENRQSTRMPHRMFVSVACQGDGSDQPDYKSATKAMELLREHRDQPFFLAVGLVRPHYPNVAPNQYFSAYPWRQMELPESVQDDINDIPKMGWGQTRSESNPIGQYPDNQRRMWSAYYATVQFMDEQVGRILGELDRLGLRDTTTVVFTSDHGYHLGEHGFWQKVNLHEEVTRVPLIIADPDHAPGHTRSLVELVDLYPTVADLAGERAPQGVQGKSLRPILADPTRRIRTDALSINRNGVCLRTDQWAFMQYADASEELYDMVNDPEQFTNLAFGKPHAEHQAVRAAMRKQLASRAVDHGLQLPGSASHQSGK